MRYAVAVAEEQSFTRAAERCYVVQSALSHQIKALEQETGAQLFARTSRRVELTPAGVAFVEEARKSLTAAERAVTDAASATGHVRGTLSIGVIPTVSAVDWMPAPQTHHHSHLADLGAVLGRAPSCELAELLRGMGLIGPTDGPGDVTHRLTGLAQEASHLSDPLVGYPCEGADAVDLGE